MSRGSGVITQRNALSVGPRLLLVPPQALLSSGSALGVSRQLQEGCVHAHNHPASCTVSRTPQTPLSAEPHTGTECSLSAGHAPGALAETPILGLLPETRLQGPRLGRRCGCCMAWDGTWRESRAGPCGMLSPALPGHILSTSGPLCEMG